MTSEDFVGHVAGHAGVPLERAEIATNVVLATLGHYLSEGRRNEIARELPGPCAAAFCAPRSTSVPLEEALLVRGEKVAHARELVASVCHVLAEELSDDALGWLRRAVPIDFARQLSRPAHERVSEAVVAGTRDTIARAKPGSHHPIADTPADRTQSQSIASANPNPHGDTKLSSTKH
jgi:uncharacterized protein (DUF2267 family)